MTNGNSRQTSMKACVDKCASTTGCVGVSYSTATSQCYMKSTLKAAVYSSNTNGTSTRAKNRSMNLLSPGAYLN